jgi:flagellar hook assembly protein FlgD
MPSPTKLLARPIAIIAALIAVLLVVTSAGVTARAQAAETTAAPNKAVIIVGPTHSETSRYLGLGETWAKRAAAQGMDVRRVFHPYATWANVKANIQGAKLVVYLGHGNGWPSPYGPFQEDTKDGFGLNPVAGGSQNTVKYYGANFIRSELKLGQNALVVLSHACYSAGRGEMHQAYPTESLAKQRVDNFASGFLAAGAGAVFAYYFEQSRDFVADLYNQHMSMDQLFMQKGTGDWNGFVGAYHPYGNSVRTPGARMHLDRNPKDSYIRAVTGNLELTTDEWVGGSVTDDVVAPELTDLAAVKSSTTLNHTETPTLTAHPTYFTPNGDGVTDTFRMTHKVSEGSYLDFVVRNADGTPVRRFSAWANQGAGSSTWDGRNGNGTVVADGVYTLTATPKDKAGNVGLPEVEQAHVMTVMKSPVATPKIFHPSDADGLADTSTLKVTLLKPAVVSWRVTGPTGKTVRTHLNEEEQDAGVLSWAWDGKDDDGEYVPDGQYWSVVTTTTDAGTYSHRFGSMVSAFKAYSATASAARGQKVTFTITTAEPLSANPKVRVAQPGLTPFTVYTYKKTATTYTATVTFRTGGSAGTAQLTTTGTDTGGQVQSSVRTFTLR